MKYDYLIVGAGFAGSVMAERIAGMLNKKVLLVDKRNHIGGNAYDEFDEHGILIHKYGPHIFHTNSKKVFEYLSRFTEWRFYEHKVSAKINDKLYPIPINRITINKLYNKNFSTEKETEEFYNSVKEKRHPISNSEDIIVNKIGHDLYEKFFKHYTKKQWNLYPDELSPAVCGRIPIRTNDDSRYFTDKYQFMPKEGYTKMFEKILAHKNIYIQLNTDYKTMLDKIKFDKMIFTGPIDYYFDYKFGKLPYRSIRFEFEKHDMESYQETAVVNYVEKNIPFTRLTEYKKLTAQSFGGKTVISKEFAQLNGEPYYPVPNSKNKLLYGKYFREAEKTKNVYFVGRLAEYQYYNMDQVVAKCLLFFEELRDK
ncbi:MAG: UDP-galactopyranose mutase [Bacteroidetes bacterium]|nr:UDP-galactopyranose mutase [Bacteroidota bacterium]